MTIDIENFTPLYSLIGGGLIGLAALILMISIGRIMGVSGIATAAIEGPKRDWQLAFIFGIFIAALSYNYISPTPAIVKVTDDTTILILAGLLVGLGTRIGSGCTSGHGVCGISRLSLRSLGAVVTFMLSGIVTVFIMQNIV